MQNIEPHRKTLESLSEDIAIVKTQLIHLRGDTNKILQILMENDDSLMSRTKVNQTRIDQLEQTQWQAKTALGGAAIGMVFNLLLWLITKKGE